MPNLNTANTSLFIKRSVLQLTTLNSNTIFPQLIFNNYPSCLFITENLSFNKYNEQEVVLKGERNQLMIWGFTEFRTDKKIYENMTFLMKILQGLMLKHVYILLILNFPLNFQTVNITSKKLYF